MPEPRSVAERREIVRGAGMCGDVSPDGERICILEPGHAQPHPWDAVTGPLAPLFAQVRGALFCTHAYPADPSCRGCAALAALSSIERHAQEMEKALVELLVVAQTDDPWLIGGSRYRELLNNARAALPAREKEEE